MQPQVIHGQSEVAQLHSEGVVTVRGNEVIGFIEYCSIGQYRARYQAQSIAIAGEPVWRKFTQGERDTNVTVERRAVRWLLKRYEVTA